jgi:hypothetical protein
VDRQWDARRPQPAGDRDVGESILKLAYRLFFSAIMVFSCIGIYSSNSVKMDLVVATAIGVIGMVWSVIECMPGDDSARVRAGADAGGKPAAGTADDARGSHRLFHAADQPGVFHRDNLDPDHDGVAGRAQQAGHITG